jgi:hypothetical protein
MYYVFVPCQIILIDHSQLSDTILNILGPIPFRHFLFKKLVVLDMVPKQVSNIGILILVSPQIV